MNNIKKIIINLLLPLIRPMNNLILKRHYKSNKVINHNYQFKKVLIIAPHMDDETIGLGGTIRKHRDYGTEVNCVFVTDGTSSVSNLSKEELAEARKKEIDRVSEILGINHVHYLNIPDGKVVNNKKNRAMLIELIKRMDADIIYSPLFIDAHPDHTSTAEVISEAIKCLNRQNLIIRLYEINCAIPPDYINCIVDISDTFEYKVKALKEFSSQAISFDGFTALNKYKCNLVEVQDDLRAVEVFLELSGNEMIEHKNKAIRHRQTFAKSFKQINREVTLLWAIFKGYTEKKKLYKESFKKEA